MDKKGKRRKKKDSHLNNNMKMGYSEYNQNEPSSPSSLLLNPIVVIKEEQQPEIKTEVEIEGEENFMPVIKHETSPEYLNVNNVNSQHFMDMNQDPFGRTDDEFKSPPPLPPQQKGEQQSERETIEMKFEVDELNWLDEREEQEQEEIHQCNNCLKIFHLNKNLEAHVRICHLKRKSKSSSTVPIKQESSINNMDIEPNVNFNSDSISTTNSQIGKRGRKKKKNQNQVSSSSVTPVSSYSLDPLDLCPHIKWDCHICPKKFTRSAQLIDHFRSHLHNKPIFCNVCKRNVTRNRTLQNHMAIHVREEPDKNKVKQMSIYCSLCKEDFPIRSKGFLSHSRCKIHKELERPFRCAVCHLQGKTRLFDSKKKIEMHLRTHQDDPYFCVRPSCQFSKKKHKKKIFKCSNCPQTFTQNSNLEYHQKRLHSFYTCIKCGQRLEGSFQKASHTRMGCTNVKRAENSDNSSAANNNNSDSNCDGFVEIQRPTAETIKKDRPFVCNLCTENNRFATIWMLRGHKRRKHKGVNPEKKKDKKNDNKPKIELKILGKSTVSISNSSSTTSNENDGEFLPYKCSLCPLGYRNKNLYHAHIKTHMF